MSGSALRPAALVVGSSTSLQIGLAVAATAFSQAGPLGAVWIRGVVGGGLLAAWLRPRPRQLSRDQWISILAYSGALASLTAFAYLAIARAPLGIVSALLMLGPLGVAAWGRRSARELLPVAVAATGVAILSLARGTDGAVAIGGIGFALGGAVAFAAYIVTGKRVTQRVEGLTGLAIALVVSALLQTPLGLIYAGDGLWDVGVLAVLALAGVLSTLVPYALEMIALRSLPAATFGLLLSFEPAVAAVVDRVVHDRTLAAAQWLGILFVSLASAITLGPRKWGPRRNRGGTMADKDRISLVAVPLFEGLAPSELSRIAALAVERVVEPGEVIVAQDDPGDEFFIIESGEVRIVVDGNEVTRLGPGDHLGEIALLFGGRRTATAEAVTATLLHVLDGEAFTEMLRQQPRLEDKILLTVSQRLRYR